MANLKQQNYKDNLNYLSKYFTHSKYCTLEHFVPDYCLDELCLPAREVNFDKAKENIELKLQRDWKYHISFLKIVDVVAQLGTCSRRQVGAVLVKNRRILATGFNGTPPGAPHCNDEICPGRNAPSGSSLSLCAAVHAEENCFLYCARYGVSAEGSTLYVSCEPCDDCMKLVETVGVKQVIFRETYPTKMSALRKYFKAQSILLSELSADYEEFCQHRLKFSAEGCL